MKRTLLIISVCSSTLGLSGCGCNGSFVKNELYRGENISGREMVVLNSSAFEIPDSMRFQKTNAKGGDLISPDRLTSDFGFGIFKQLSHKWRKLFKIRYLAKVTPDSTKQITESVPDYNSSDQVRKVEFTIYSKSSFKDQRPDIAVYLQNGPITIDSLKPEPGSRSSLYRTNATGYYIIWDYWRELPICYGRFTQIMRKNEFKERTIKINPTKLGEAAAYPITFCLDG